MIERLTVLLFFLLLHTHILGSHSVHYLSALFSCSVGRKILCNANDLLWATIKTLWQNKSVFVVDTRSISESL